MRVCNEDRGKTLVNSTNKARAALEDLKVHVRFKLSALWAAVMFCYIYGDYFSLFESGRLKGMMAGEPSAFGMANQGVLVGVALLMAIPSVMIFLSLALRPVLNRWLNLIFGSIFTVIMLATMPGAWPFYMVLGVVEMVLTVLIVGYAWRWPRQEVA